MSSQLLRAALALTFTTLLAGAPAFARCSCLDPHDDESREKIRTLINALPSENERAIARNFRRDKLSIDAANTYQSALDKADKEVADAVAKNVATPGAVPEETIETLKAHQAELQLEVAEFLYMQGKVAPAAGLKERALATQIALHKELDLATEYNALAKLYESANQPAKAAEFYKRLADTLAATKGRYSPEVVDATMRYNRLAKSQTGSHS